MAAGNCLNRFDFKSSSWSVAPSCLTSAERLSSLFPAKMRIFKGRVNREGGNCVKWLLLKIFLRICCILTITPCPRMLRRRGKKWCLEWNGGCLSKVSMFPMNAIHKHTAETRRSSCCSGLKKCDMLNLIKKDQNLH